MALIIQAKNSETGSIEEYPLSDLLEANAQSEGYVKLPENPTEDHYYAIKNGAWEDITSKLQ